MNISNLEKKLKGLGIEDSHYSLSGELKSDSIILYHNYEKWEVFYLDERGVRRQLNVFSKEEQACEFIYELLIKNNNERIKELASELETNSPWKGKTIKELEQELNKLNLRINSGLLYMEIFFFLEIIILCKEDKQWNLYINSNNRKVLIKSYIHEDTMCSFLYSFCLGKLSFEKDFFGK